MFSDPAKNLRALGISDGMIIADLGAGTGFYALAAAALVPSGKVYAIEIQRDYLATIQNKATEAKATNLECIWGDIEKPGGTKLGDGIVDIVIASNVLFQVENKDRFIEEAKRILKPGGKLLFVDWSDESSLGPKRAALVPKETIKNLIASKGFALESDIDAGEHHYGMIFIRPTT